MKVTNLKQALAMIEAVKQLQYPEELKVQNGSKYSFFITHLDGMIGVRQNRQTDNLLPGDRNIEDRETDSVKKESPERGFAYRQKQTPVSWLSLRVFSAKVNGFKPLDCSFSG